MKSLGRPGYYLGGHVEELHHDWNDDGAHVALSAQTYVENVVKKIEELLEITLRISTRSPMDYQYHPETDALPFLSPEKSSIYRGLVGSANWAIMLGRSDITYATNAMANATELQRCVTHSLVPQALDQGETHY